MTDSTTPNPAPESAAVPEATQAPAAAEAPAQEVVEAPAPQLEPVAAVEPEPAPVVEAEPPAPVAIPVAEPAPLVAPVAATPAPEPAPSSDGLAVPLKLLNELLAKIGAAQLNSLADLVPLLRIVALAVVAGIALKLTSATLGAIDDLPLVGGLLELVGLVSLLNFLARNAFKQQKRAELLARIQKLKTDLLG